PAPVGSLHVIGTAGILPAPVGSLHVIGTAGILPAPVGSLHVIGTAGILPAPDRGLHVCASFSVQHISTDLPTGCRLTSAGWKPALPGCRQSQRGCRLEAGGPRVAA